MPQPSSPADACRRFRRVVLVDDQRVERGAEPRRLDRGETQVRGGRAASRWPAPGAATAGSQRGVRVEPDADRHGGEEQPEHVLDARQVGRPARDRRCRTRRRRGRSTPPAPPPRRPGRTVLRVRLRRRASSRRASPSSSPVVSPVLCRRHRRARRVVRGDKGGFGPGEFVRARRAGGVPVAGGQPGQILPVRRRRAEDPSPPARRPR